MSTVIRLARVEDVPQIHAIYAPIVTDTVISFELEPPGIEELTRRMLAIQTRHPWLVLETDGEVLGYVYASTHRERLAYQWSADVTVYVHPRAHRRGVGLALYTSLFEVLALQGYVNLYAGITLPNAGSVGLHERIGFRCVGVFENEGYKLGAWRNVGWWHKAIGTFEAPTRAPRKLAEVMESSEFQACLAKGLSLLLDKI